MVVLREEINAITKTMKANGVVQGPQQPNSTTSSLFNGGNKFVFMESGNMRFDVVGGKGINDSSIATIKTEAIVLKDNFSTAIGEIGMEAGPFVGARFNRLGTSGVAGGSISFVDVKSGTTFGCEGSVSTSTVGNLSSQNIPNTIGSCSLSFKF